MRAPALLLLTILVGACTPPEGRFRCATNVECPSGWTCRADSLCWSTPGMGGVDAGADAGSDASVVPGTDGGVDAGLDAFVAPVDMGVDASIPCSASEGHVTRPGGGTICSPFGGLYLRSTDTGLQCRYPNPFTDDCTCPDGFTDGDATSFRTDVAGTVDTNAHLHVCLWPNAIATPGWGGLYVFDETGPCPYANRLGGSTPAICNCPSMATQTVADWRGRNSAGHQVQLVFCGDAGMPRTGAFSGAFVRRNGMPSACSAQAGICASGSPCHCAPTDAVYTFHGVIDTASCVTDALLCAPMF